MNKRIMYAALTMLAIDCVLIPTLRRQTRIESIHHQLDVNDKNTRLNHDLHALIRFHAPPQEVADITGLYRSTLQRRTEVTLANDNYPKHTYAEAYIPKPRADAFTPPD